MRLQYSRPVLRNRRSQLSPGLLGHVIKMVEEAVTSEPVSAPNSLLTGKNTGNFIKEQRFKAGQDVLGPRFANT